MLILTEKIVLKLKSRYMYVLYYKSNIPRGIIFSYKNIADQRKTKKSNNRRNSIIQMGNIFHESKTRKLMKQWVPHYTHPI